MNKLKTILKTTGEKILIISTYIISVAHNTYKAELAHSSEV